MDRGESSISASDQQQSLAKIRGEELVQDEQGIGKFWTRPLFSPKRWIMLSISTRGSTKWTSRLTRDWCRIRLRLGIILYIRRYPCLNPWDWCHSGLGLAFLLRIWIVRSILRSWKCRPSTCSCDNLDTSVSKVMLSLSHLIRSLDINLGCECGQCIAHESRLITLRFNHEGQLGPVLSNDYSSWALEI